MKDDLSCFPLAVVRREAFLCSNNEFLTLSKGFGSAACSKVEVSMLLLMPCFKVPLSASLIFYEAEIFGF
jgi:hypothetical protein